MDRSLPSPRSRFGIRFSLLGRRWRHFVLSQLSQAGLTDATWMPLIHLHERGGGITQKELALMVGVDGSSLVRVLDIHERNGLIERRRDAEDRRLRRIHLTDAGVRRVEAIREELAAAEHRLLDDLSDAEIAQMLDWLGRIDRKLTEVEAGQKAGATGQEAEGHDEP